MRCVHTCTPTSTQCSINSVLDYIQSFTMSFQQIDACYCRQLFIGVYCTTTTWHYVLCQYAYCANGVTSIFCNHLSLSGLRGGAGVNPSWCWMTGRVLQVASSSQGWDISPHTINCVTFICERKPEYPWRTWGKPADTPPSHWGLSALIISDSNQWTKWKSPYVSAQIFV